MMEQKKTKTTSIIIVTWSISETKSICM